MAITDVASSREVVEAGLGEDCEVALGEGCNVKRVVQFDNGVEGEKKRIEKGTIGGFV